MTKFNRFVTFSAAALMFAAAAGLASPALAATVSPAPVTPAAGTTFTPPLVMETADSPVYYAPGQLSTVASLLYADETWYVLGQDSTGQWAQIFVTDAVSVWLPKADLALGNTPLPITG
jgi:hypothetical protein